MTSGHEPGQATLPRPAARGAVAEPPRYPAKRAAIARAALDLFVQDGYERTSVDAIAAKAGVSKRTVYSHFADKEQLFLSVVEDTTVLLMDQAAEIADRELGGPGDIRLRLVGFIGGIAHTITRSPERAALIRMILTEAPHFPALLDRWRGRRMLTPLLGRAVSELAADPAMDIPDLAQAADYLSALTLGQINNRSLFGLITLSDDDVDSIIAGGTSLFLRAYRRA